MFITDVHVAVVQISAKLNCLLYTYSTNINIVEWHVGTMHVHVYVQLLRACMYTVVPGNQ